MFIRFIVSVYLLLISGISKLEAEPTETKLKTLYNRLDPVSISKHLAFYELYSQSNQGQCALKDVYRLLLGEELCPLKGYAYPPIIAISTETIDALVAMVNKPLKSELVLLDDEMIKAFSLFSSRLNHFSLKGHLVWNENEVLKLPNEEIDLARGVFLSQFGEDRKSIQSYECLIDLMALQIMARLPKNALPKDKIIAINAFIFEEMGFRFPPHSQHTKEIDQYTFLPSVIDSHRGVCLGVSILYLCIAQRLGLPLEIITPPGHIYLRFCSEKGEINIETTARGIHIESDSYLGLTTRQLQQRTLREVIGMAHFNQASVYWQKGEFQQALLAYKKAEPYMDGDPLLKEFMGYAYLLVGNQQDGERLLREIEDYIPSHAISKGTTIEDYFKGEVDAEGIKTLLAHSEEEDRQSKLEKKASLERILERFPRFRAGLLSLASCWLELHRHGEALEMLNAYQSIDSNNPEVNFYLSLLHMNRLNYPQAWMHFHHVEKILHHRNHHPKVIKELRRELLSHYPE